MAIAFTADLLRRFAARVSGLASGLALAVRPGRYASRPKRRGSERPRRMTLPLAAAGGALPLVSPVTGCGFHDQPGRAGRNNGLTCAAVIYVNAPRNLR